MARKIIITDTFRKCVARCKKSGYDLELLKEAIRTLAKGKKLPDVYRPHKLPGKDEECWICHLHVDWALIWQQTSKELTLLVTGSKAHTALF
ncbi:MAG: type II toxin-antitoxin system YafQ family toxin [Bacteroidales bacterium]|nr:type II toxin-antitoxin system YafQ family toxin [Bacteroidales bacterium]